MGDAILRKVARGAGLERIHGQELVALGGEQQERRIGGAVEEALEALEPLAARQRTGEQDGIAVGERLDRRHRGRRVLELDDTGIGPLDLEVIAQDPAVARVRVDQAELHAPGASGG